MRKTLITSIDDRLLRSNSQTAANDDDDDDDNDKYVNVRW